MKRHSPSNVRLCLSLPVCITLSASSAALLTTSAWAIHSEPTKPAKIAPAKVKPPELTPTTLISLVRTAKILEPDYPVQATLVNGEATLTTVRHPKATDQDCKIDAVLLAKAVMDVYPKEVSRVKLVLGASNSDSMQEVAVTTGDVKAYATGTISKDELLTSLELKKTENAGGDKDSTMDVQTEGSSPVAAGPFRSQRQLQAGRIEKLKANGTGTQPYEEMLAKIEADVQKPRSEMSLFDLKKEVNGLSSRLHDQEQAIRAAQHIENGANSKALKALEALGPDPAKPAKGGPNPGDSERRGGQGPRAEFKQRIDELRQQGQDVNSFVQQMEHIHQMDLAGNHDEAKQERKDLAAKLGITLKKWSRNSNGPQP